MQSCISKSLRREIERTARRGPTPEEVVLFNRWEAAAKKRREQEKAWTHFEAAEA